MIYLKKGEAVASVNNEKVAVMLEEEGFTRIQGREKTSLIVRRIAKNVILGFVIPGVLALGAYYLSGGEEQSFGSAIVSIFVFSSIHDIVMS